MARPSATARAASSSSTSREPDGLGHREIVTGSSRSRRVAVSGSSRWWRTTVARISTSAGAGRCGRRCRGRRPRRRWSGRRASPCRCRAAARETSSRSGRDTSRVNAAARAAASIEVPVDGVAVHGVALRAVPHALPVGQQPDEQAGLVERLPDRYGRAPGAEQRDERVARLGGPGHGQRRRLGGERGRRSRARAAARPRAGRGRGAQHEHGVRARVGAAGEHDLAVLLDDAVGERAGGPARRGAGEQPVDASRQVASKAWATVRAASASRRSSASASSRPSVAGDRVLLLEHEPVGAARGDQVQRVPDVEQQLVGLADPRARGRGDPGGGDGPHRLHVAQPAAGLLEVGFEQEGQLAARARRACRSASRSSGSRRRGRPASRRARSRAPPASARGRPRRAGRRAGPSTALRSSLRDLAAPRRRCGPSGRGRRRSPRSGTRCGRRASPRRRGRRAAGPGRGRCPGRARRARGCRPRPARPRASSRRRRWPVSRSCSSGSPGRPSGVPQAAPSEQVGQPAVDVRGPLLAGRGVRATSSPLITG